MTGSALAPVIIPIVALVFGFLWIGAVYYAAAHPAVHHVGENRSQFGEREAIARQGSEAEQTDREHPRPDQRAA